MKNRISKNHIFFIVYVCLFFLILVFVICPLMRKIEKDFSQLYINQQMMESFSQEEISFQKFRAISKEVNNNLTKADSLFFNADIPVDFINFLEKTASTSDVSIKISSVTSAKKSKENPWPFLVFNLEVSGDFSDFARFIERIHNSPYLIEIENINIKRIQQKNSKEEKRIPAIVSSNFSLKVITK